MDRTIDYARSFSAPIKQHWPRALVGAFSVWNLRPVITGALSISKIAGMYLALENASDRAVLLPSIAVCIGYGVALTCVSSVGAGLGIMAAKKNSLSLARKTSIFNISETALFTGLYLMSAVVPFLAEYSKDDLAEDGAVTPLQVVWSLTWRALVMMSRPAILEFGLWAMKRDLEGKPRKYFWQKDSTETATDEKKKDE